MEMDTSPSPVWLDTICCRSFCGELCGLDQSKLQQLIGQLEDKVSCNKLQGTSKIGRSVPYFTLSACWFTDGLVCRDKKRLDDDDDDDAKGTLGQTSRNFQISAVLILMQ